MCASIHMNERMCMMQEYSMSRKMESRIQKDLLFKAFIRVSFKYPHAFSNYTIQGTASNIRPFLPQVSPLRLHRGYCPTL